MSTSSVKMMLLGIGVMVFGVQFPAIADRSFGLLVVLGARDLLSFYMLDTIGTLFVIAGVVLLLVGYFRRERAA